MQGRLACQAAKGMPPFTFLNAAIRYVSGDWRGGRNNNDESLTHASHASSSPSWPRPASLALGSGAVLILRPFGGPSEG